MFRKSLRKSQLETEGDVGGKLDPGDFAVLKDISDDLRRLGAEVEAQGVPLSLFRDKLCPPLVEEWWRERRKTETQTGQWAWTVIKVHFLEWGDAPETIPEHDDDDDEGNAGEDEGPEPEAERTRRAETLLNLASEVQNVTIIQAEFRWPSPATHKKLLEIEQVLEEKLEELRLDGRPKLGGMRLLGCCARCSGSTASSGRSLFTAVVCEGVAPVVVVGAVVLLLEAAAEGDAIGFSTRTFAVAETSSFRSFRAAFRAFTPAAAGVVASAAAAHARMSLLA